MITAKKALEIILENTEDFGTEEIPFLESLGRMLVLFSSRWREAPIKKAVRAIWESNSSLGLYLSPKINIPIIVSLVSVH